MIFLKKQHEDIANGFLSRIDALLRRSDKVVAGYGIDDGVETLKLRVGQATVELRIEGEMWHYRQPDAGACAVADGAEDAKEVLY